MNSGTTERVYETLKRAIQRREMRPGARLDPGLIAPDLRSSVTPVREALRVLEGEGLVEARHGGGFSLPHVDEPGLRDLYAWSCDILLLALRRTQATEDAASIGARLEDPADEAGRLFLSIAKHSSNDEHRRALATVNDRLRAARTVEPAVLLDIATELSAIERALRDQDAKTLRRLVVSYHRRRARVAAEIVRRLYRHS